jgi:hypothetical protein
MTLPPFQSLLVINELVIRCYKPNLLNIHTGIDDCRLGTDRNVQLGKDGASVVVHLPLQKVQLPRNFRFAHVASQLE